MAEKQLCALCRVNRESDTTHICGSCVPKLLGMTQEKLEDEYVKAETLNSIDQMWAIRCFMSPKPVVKKVGGRKVADGVQT